MLKQKIFSIFIVISVILLGYFYLINPEIEARKDSVITESEKSKLFKLGLDLVGGSQLTYDADISKLEKEDIDDSMKALKETLVRRLNPFGTSDVSVVIEDESLFSNNDNSTKRVIIQIPGESDPEEAKKKIGKVPIMEFKIWDQSLDIPDWKNTKLSGAHIENAQLVYDPQTSEPVVQLTFNEVGGKLFSDLTEKNVGEVMGIFLDGEVISDPVIRDVIKGGVTIISFGSNQSSNEKLAEATELSRDLKFGALPVPIISVSSNVISASLGKDILEKGLVAGVWGIAIVMLFLIIFYRVSGLLASIALTTYVVVVLSIFKLFGFVFTAAGIAGFIISIGMAVDANVLIFEMVRDELSKGSKIIDAVKNGFSRAWLSIRDGSTSSVVTAIILFYMTTSLVQGFALTFGFGVLISMLTAIIVTRIFLLSVVGEGNKSKRKKILFGNYKKN